MPIVFTSAIGLSDKKLQGEFHGNGISQTPQVFIDCQVMDSVLTKMEQQDIHKVIDQLNAEERMIIYGIFFENKTQTQMAEIMGISRQVLAYKLKTILNKMREMYMKEFF